MSSLLSVDTGLRSSMDRSSPTSSDDILSFRSRQRLHSFASAISERSERVKQILERPPTPEDSDTESTADVVDPEQLKLQDFVPDVDYIEPDKPATEEVDNQKETRWVRFKKVTISAQSRLYMVWLSVVSLFVVYNAFSIPLRASYPYMTPENRPLWLFADYLADIIYLIDMIVVKPKLSFMKGGIEERNIKETKKHYLMNVNFKLDLLAILPLDLLYAHPKLRFNTLLRLPRILKIGSYSEWMQKVDSYVTNPYLLRIGQTLISMLYLIHCNSCIFYTFSMWQGPDPDNHWIYDNEGNAYIRCFYFTTKLAISIGNNPTPTNLLEYIYCTFSWMMGVFVFALLLGQIRDIVANASKSKDYYRKSMDATLEHLKVLKLQEELLEKARLWYVHTWAQQGTLDESQLIEKIPKKLQTDLAISVHYKTLGKVSLFQNVDNALIRDLVLKLKPVLFLPGDYVCRKGEVGKEMYIINQGIVEVVGGPEGKTVFVTLRSGSVFGEISLLASRGKNRRTADVRSKGFSFLFVLSKEDLDETTRDYPEAEQILKKKARKMMRQAEKRDQKMAQEKVEEDLDNVVSVVANKDPKLLKTVIQVMNPEGQTTKILKATSK